MMPVSAHLLEQRNRGRVFLQSGDPHEQLGIDSCMLEHPEDSKRWSKRCNSSMNWCIRTPAKEFYGPLIQPGAGDEWGRFRGQNL